MKINMEFYYKRNELPPIWKLKTKKENRLEKLRTSMTPADYRRFHEKRAAELLGLA